jgi:O-antigen/teichoic acid export membrane protein
MTTNAPAPQPSAETAPSLAGLRLARFVALSFGYMAVRFLLAPLQIRAVTSLLDKAQYGALTLTMLTVSFLVTAVSLGHFEYIVRRLPGRPGAYQFGVMKLVSRFFGALALATAAVGVLGLGALRPAKIPLNWPHLLAGGLALVVLVVLLQRIFFLIARTDWVRVRTLQILYADTWFLPLLVAAAVAPVTLTSVMLVWVTWLLVALWLACRWVRAPGPVGSSPVQLAAIVRFGAPLLPLLLGEWLFRLADRYVLLGFKNLEAVANYSLCFNVALIVYTVAASAQDLFIPVLNRERNRLDTFDLETLLRSERLRTLFTAMLKYGLLIVLPGGLFLLFCRAQLLAILSGVKFRDAAFILPFLAPMPLVFLLGMLCNQVQLLLNRSVVVGAVSLLAAALNLGLNLLLVPRYGEVGAAVALTLSLALIAACAGGMIRVWRWIVWRRLQPARLLTLLLLGAAGKVLWRAALGGQPFACLAACAVWDLVWIFALGLVKPADFACMTESADSNGLPTDSLRKDGTADERG